MKISDLIKDVELTSAKEGDVLTMEHIEAALNIAPPPCMVFDLELYKANNPHDDLSWLEVTG